MDRTAHFYAQPTYVRGGGLPIYSGSRRQRGGNVLGALKSMFLPIIKNVGKRGAREALGLAKDVMGDMFRGKDIKQSLKTRGLNRAKNFGGDLLGTALGTIRRSIEGPASKKPAAAPSRKRVARRKAKQNPKRLKNNF